jgi:predicted Rossmann fold flavoprotein
MYKTDVVILGAGAAGLFCAGVAQQQGLKVLILDHYPKLAEKIRISGGGRSNFTNSSIDPQMPHRHYVGQNPQFARSALSRYSAQNFVELIKKHNIPYHEKHLGQLFCDRSAEDLIQMLLKECESGAMGGEVKRWQPCQFHSLSFSDSPHAHYTLQTSMGAVECKALVVASGGLSIPAIGASGIGYTLAEQFGLRIAPTKPGLVPLSIADADWSRFKPLSGLSFLAEISHGQGKKKISFQDHVLITHKGLSGPATLQISNYWQTGHHIELDLLPDIEPLPQLIALKQQSKKSLSNELLTWLPNRLIHAWTDHDPMWQKSMADTSQKALESLTLALKKWDLSPNGDEGYKKAEVTVGGVDTRDLSQQTLESKQKGLYFIGEVVDITGWLGGYNFQWAWSSAHACAMSLANQIKTL